MEQIYRKAYKDLEQYGVKLEQISMFRKISIHENLVARVETLVKDGKYRSIAEFISEATRLRLEALEKKPRKPKGKILREA